MRFEGREPTKVACFTKQGADDFGSKGESKCYTHTHCVCVTEAPSLFQRNPRAHKNKIGTSPPPPKPPSKTRNFTDMGFPAERTHFFQASIKLAQPFPAPELRTRIYGHEDFSDCWLVGTFGEMVCSKQNWNLSLNFSQIRNTSQTSQAVEGFGTLGSRSWLGKGHGRHAIPPGTKPIHAGKNS